MEMQQTASLKTTMRNLNDGQSIWALQQTAHSQTTPHYTLTIWEAEVQSIQQMPLAAHLKTTPQDSEVQ